MRLFASILEENHHQHEHFADLDVIKDTEMQHGDIQVRRIIEGTVTEIGPIWSAYRFHWMQFKEETIDGLNYLQASLLQIDHDLYNEVYLYTDEAARSVRIILDELYTDKLEDYRPHVEERNRLIQQVHDQLDERELQRRLSDITNRTVRNRI
jgi:hypothetical protein